jgi:hypothetical protein
VKSTIGGYKCQNSRVANIVGCFVRRRLPSVLHHAQTRPNTLGSWQSVTGFSIQHERTMASVRNRNKATAPSPVAAAAARATASSSNATPVRAAATVSSVQGLRSCLLCAFCKALALLYIAGLGAILLPQSRACT